MAIRPVSAPADLQPHVHPGFGRAAVARVPRWRVASDELPVCRAPTLRRAPAGDDCEATEALSLI
jgi:hypothetical protein